MAAAPKSLADAAEQPPWYPGALLEVPCDTSSFENGLPSPWGRVYGWSVTDALQPGWWQGPHEGIWGDWPTEVGRVEVLSQDVSVISVLVNDAFVAHLYPFQTGKDVSNLALFEPWRASLDDAPLLLPIAGMKNQHGDQIAVFPRHQAVVPSDAVPRAHELVNTLGRVHAALVPHATPNTERRWNERLKAIEDQLKTTTLWRAPHTKHVVGLPPVNAHLACFADVEGGLVVVPQPRPLVDHLLAPEERLPGVATVAMLEQLLSLENVFATTAERREFYERWGAIVPSGWTSPSTLSTANGGVWIWRYHAMLLMLAEAKAFGHKERVKQCDRWLFDVSRIQARLGELRTVHAVRRGGLWVAAIAAVFGSPAVQVPTVVGSLAVSLVAHFVHQRRMPPPF